MRTSLSTNIVRIRKKYFTNYQTLDNLESGEDLLDLIESYLEDRTENSAQYNEIQLLFKVDHFNVVRDDRVISGIIKKGDYGYESELYNLGTEQINYLRQIDDAELLPFYFLFYLPKDSEKGILILERSGVRGVQGLVLFNLKEFLEAKNEMMIDVRPLVPVEAIKDFLRRGRITKLRFIKFELPHLIEDAFDNADALREEEGYSELRIVAGNSRNLPVRGHIEQVLEGDAQFSDLLDIKEFPYDNVKVEVKVGDSVRTINFAKLGDLNANYDVTAYIERGENGHPTFESIDEYAKRLLIDLAVEIR